MAKNLMPAIAALLGVEVGEEFMLKDEGSKLPDFDLGIYKFGKNEMLMFNYKGEYYPCDASVLELLCYGEKEIVKLPRENEGMDEKEDSNHDD